MPRFLGHYNAKAEADLDHLEVALPSDTGQHSKKALASERRPRALPVTKEAHQMF